MTVEELIASEQALSIGKMMFYGGAALLVFTILLAVFFAVKKPVYRPESEAIRPPGDAGTQRLKNGYPTAPVTVRRDTGKSAAAPKTEAVRETEALPRTGGLPKTEYLPEDEAQKTEFLPEDQD